MNVTFEDIFKTLCCKQNNPIVTRVLEDLGIGKRFVVEQFVYVDYSSEGVCFSFDQHLCVSSVFFYSSDSDKNHCEYKGIFPMGLKFGVSREDVRSSFKQIIACAETAGSGSIPAITWDKFAYDGHVIHVEYSTGNFRANRVTISCGRGEVESARVEGAGAGTLMNILRNWFEPKRSRIVGKDGDE